MSSDAWLTFLVAALIAGYLARALLALRLQAPPEVLVKTNVNGMRVPAVIGGPLVLSSLMVLAGVAIAGALGWGPARPTGVTSAVAFVTAVMAIAGAWDDRRGDERPRGFAGHLGAARTRQLTGGLIKIIAGVIAGAGAGAFLVFGQDVVGEGGRFDRDAVLTIVECLLLVALTANFVNLTDRAPGRAAKVTLLVALPLLVFGDPLWSVMAASVIGALLGCVAADLGERAMLGDAGANPLGAVLGLGLAVSLQEPWRWVVILVLLALNLISERWSFSRAIERTPPLRWLDGLGRTGRSPSDRTKSGAE